MSDIKKSEIKIEPIGAIRRNGSSIVLDVLPEYRPALRALDQFSHIMVFWWADCFSMEERKSTLQTKPPYAEEHLTGIFGTRSPIRPNPILMTTCKLLRVDENRGEVAVENLDALDGSPLLDIKAYFPVCDRVKEAAIPSWLVGWPEWMPEEGIGLEEWEQENAA